MPQQHSHSREPMEEEDEEDEEEEEEIHIYSDEGETAEQSRSLLDLNYE